METQCPHCAQSIEIDAETLEVLKEAESFACPTCGGTVPVGGPAKARVPADRALPSTPAALVAQIRRMNRNMRIFGVLALLVIGGLGIYLASRSGGDVINTTQNIRREIFKNEYFTRLIASGATTEKELEAVAEAAAYGSGFIGVSGEKWSFKDARDLAQRTGASLLDVAVVARASRKELGNWLAETFPSTTGSTVWVCEGQEPRLMDCPDLLTTSAPYRPHRVLLVWPQITDWQNHGWSWTIQPQFDEVKPFSEWGLAAVRKGKLWGFVDESGKLVQEPQFDLVESFSEHGCAKVRVTTAEGNQLWGLVNSKGVLVAKPEWGEVQDQIHGFTPVSKAGKWGYLDASGKLAIPCEWDDAWRFSPEGYAVVTRSGFADSMSKRGIIDRSGKIIIQPEWDGAINFCQEGLGMMRRGGSWALFHQSGRQITPPEIRLDWNRLAWKDRRWDLGVLPGVGEVWSPDGKSSSDERAMAILQTSALLSQRDKFNYRLEMQTTRDGTGFLNAMGEWKYPPQRGRARPFHQGRAAIEKDGKWGFIDVTGKLVVNQEWDEVKDFSGGYAAVLRGGKWGFVHEDGRLAVEPAWQMCGNAREDMAAVSQNNRWGHVNLSTGQLTVPTQWDEVQPFHEGRAAVRLGQKWGFVDTAGKVIAAPQWHEVSDFIDGLAAVRVEPPAGTRGTGRYSHWQFISLSGKPALAGKTVKTWGNNPPTRRNGFISAMNANYEWAMFDAEGREQPNLWWQKPLATGLMLTQPERRGGYLDRHGNASISTDLVTTAGGMVMPQVSSRADLMSDFIPHAAPPKYGLMDINGKVLVPPTWDEAEVVSPDWVWFRLGGKCGLADKTGRIHIQPVWDELEVLPVRSGGLAEDGKSILIGWERGTPILSPWVKVKQAGQTSILRLSDAKPVFPGTLTNAEFVDFHGTKHLVIRQPDATAGVIYSLFDPQAGRQTRFPDAARMIWNWNTATAGLLWQQHRTTQRWHLMREDGSDTGHTQPDLEKPYGWGFIETLGRLHDAGGWFFIGPDGKPISPEKWEDARDFSGGLAAVMRGQKWGFIGLDGRLVTELIYDEVRDVSRGLAAVLQADRWGYLDASGKPAIPFIWDAAESFFTWKGEPEGNVTPELDVAVVSFNNSQALIDREGRLIIDPGQSMLKREGAAFVNGTDQLIVMQKAGKADVVVRKWQVSTNTSRWRSPDDPVEVSPARRWQKELGGHALVDENGTVLTPKSGFAPPRASSGPDAFALGNLLSSKGPSERNGLIRKDGREVLEPKYERIAWVAPGIAAVWNREEGGLFSTDGRWLFKDNASTRIARFGSSSSARSSRQHRHGLVVIEDIPKWGYARLNREAPAPKAP